ncbi:MAG TPA: ABC transporter permease subunit, partial [Ilumatobacteraceae bacterium]|nr:ABC transporter permease subunit [Ilumatobacteraceae bacterium]
IIYVVFGGSMTARLFVCVMISFFPIVTNALFGMKSVERSQHDLFTLRDASRWTRLIKLQLPSALPNIFTGFRISAGLSIIGAVVGEQFFRGGSKPGVG